MILPIYHTWLQVLLLSVMLQEAYFLLTHDPPVFDIHFDVPDWARFLLGGFNLGIRYGSYLRI